MSFFSQMQKMVFLLISVWMNELGMKKKEVVKFGTSKNCSILLCCFPTPSSIRAELLCFCDWQFLILCILNLWTFLNSPETLKSTLQLKEAHQKSSKELCRNLVENLIKILRIFVKTIYIKCCWSSDRTSSNNLVGFLSETH